MKTTLFLSAAALGLAVTTGAALGNDPNLTFDPGGGIYYDEGRYTPVFPSHLKEPTERAFVPEPKPWPQVTAPQLSMSPDEREFPEVGQDVYYDEGRYVPTQID